jgi:hypothetical protein
MARRNKPSFKDKVSDPERATRNLFLRDMLLTRHVQQQAQSLNLRLFEIDGSRSVEHVAALVEQHFEPFIKGA